MVAAKRRTTTTPNDYRTLTVQLDPETYTRAKVYSARSRKSLRIITVEALTWYLDKYEPLLATNG
jgi:hypothetical protein